MSGSEIGDVLRRAVGAGQIPGAVFAAGRPGMPAGVVVAGDAQLRGGPRREMRRDTLFDLASLTKVVATLPAVLRLVQRGEAALDDRVCRFLPGFRGDGRESVSVRQLLAHTSGLPAEVPFWQRYDDPADARRALLRVGLDHPPGQRVSYSDIGFMLLGHIVETVTGTALDAGVGELVTGPLGMTKTFFSPNAASGHTAGQHNMSQLTASGHTASQHNMSQLTASGPTASQPTASQPTASQPTASQPSVAATELQPDGSALTGIVHDENARFLGGVAGHAGLFAPLDDLVRYLELAWLGAADGFLSAASLRAACRIQTEGPGRRGLGWVLRGNRADFLGDRWPSGSISHTGFTGTSLACDPASGTWAVLLTNDVHFGRGRGVIRGLRESVHDACSQLFW